MFKTLDLENFLKEHIGQWWTPNQLGKELSVDIRTVKNVIRRLDVMTPQGWKLVIAERGDRLFCIHMERDMENSGNIVKAEVSEVEINRTITETTPTGQQKLHKYQPSG